MKSVLKIIQCNYGNKRDCPAAIPRLITRGKLKPYLVLTKGYSNTQCSSIPFYIYITNMSTLHPSRCFEILSMCARRAFVHYFTQVPEIYELIIVGHVFCFGDPFIDQGQQLTIYQYNNIYIYLNHVFSSRLYKTHHISMTALYLYSRFAIVIRQIVVVYDTVFFKCLNVRPSYHRYVVSVETCVCVLDVNFRLFIIGLAHVKRIVHDMNVCVVRLVCPIYITDDLPDVNDGAINRTACVKHDNVCCQEEINVAMKNCTDFMVFLMPSFSGCQRVFCFGDCPVYLEKW